MSNSTQEAPTTLEPTDVAEILRALSNPNRLRIFLLVRDACGSQDSRGLKVGEIADAMDISQSTVSHHLKELEHANLIRLERQGKNVYCCALRQPLEQTIDFLASGEAGS